ncbi:serine-rich adhesin for platelets-like isoform X2 [Macrobrachium rosenbergii]|uniref:serine-rich adhesin for platelets-like isoform X2 n=1 Tax=Macrobrachium rosenbergii TaxID=79674 RepID=UPI0034D6DDB2
MAKNCKKLHSTLNQSSCYSSTVVSTPKECRSEVGLLPERPIELLKGNQAISNGHVAQGVRRFEMKSSDLHTDTLSVKDDDEKGLNSISSQSSTVSRGYGNSSDAYETCSSDQYSSLSSGMGDAVSSDIHKAFSSLPPQGTVGTQFLGVNKAYNPDRQDSAYPDDLESRSDFSASDDGESDSSGISKGSPRFVRSFNRRVRTRDNRGRNFHRINAIRVRSRPRQEIGREETMIGKTSSEQNNNENMFLNGSLEEIPRAVQNRSPSYSEASSGDRFDSDTFEMCSPGSDDVFWGSDKNLKLTLDQSVGINVGGSAPNLEIDSGHREVCEKGLTSFDAVSEKSSPSLARRESTDNSLLPFKVGEEWTRIKESSSGLSLLSRLSKSVNIKRKYGKVCSKNSSEKVLPDPDLRYKDNLEKIMECAQERTEPKYLGIRSQSLTPALDIGSRETDNESLDSEDCCLNVSHLGQRSHSLTPTFEHFDDDDNETVKSKCKDLHKNVIVSEVKSQLLKPVKPVPPPRSKKPQIGSVNYGLGSSERDSHSSSESLNIQNHASGRIEEDLPLNQSSDYGRLRSVSNTFCNLWPQLFSNSSSNSPSNSKVHEKDYNMNKKGNSRSEVLVSDSSKKSDMPCETVKNTPEESNSDSPGRHQETASSNQAFAGDTEYKERERTEKGSSDKLKVPERRSLPAKPQGSSRRILPPKPQLPARSSSYAPQPPSASSKPKQPQVPTRSSSYKPNFFGNQSNANPQLPEFESVPQKMHFPGYASEGPSTSPASCSSPVSTRKGTAEVQKETVSQKKAKLFSSFSFHPELSNKKMESEKNLPKDKKHLKERRSDGDKKGIDGKSFGNQSRIRRTGAVKKSDEQRFHSQDDSFSPGTTRRMLPRNQNENRKSPEVQGRHLGPGLSLDGSSHTGAIPKSSYLNKTFHILNRDIEARRTNSDPKIQEHNRSEGESDQAIKRSSDKLPRSPGKKMLDRSVSVPFWTKLYMATGSNGQTPVTVISEAAEKTITEEKTEPFDQKLLTAVSKDEVVKQKLTHTTSSPSNTSGSSSPFLRKVSHKRTRSHDVTKTFKEDFMSLPPERSASHDNLAKLKDSEGVDMPVLAVEFASPDSPPQMEFKSLRFANGGDSYNYKSSQKHKSCNNIIDMNGDVLEPMSPKFARTFKDSRLKSASAFCLTSGHAKKISAAAALKRDGGGEDSCPSGESTPPWPSVGFADGDRRNMRASQQLYTSPYELTTHARDKPYFQRLIGMFHIQVSDSKMDSLVQQLDLYSRQGIPKQPHLLACQTYQIDQEVVVEDSWRVLVEGHEQLDDRQEQQQSAIWELVETEATYIHMLKVITDLFLSCLCNLQNESLLCEIDTDKLFSNIQEIYNANLTFWREHICRMLEVARSSRQPLDPSLLSDGFYKFDELFHPYTRYCLDQSHCQLYCKEKDHDNEYFKMYLAWCETQKECNRLRLVDILVQPMQRLTKYSLLLKAIHKKTNSEDHKIILQDMITHVENFVSNVNSALRHKHEQERLRDIAKRIEAYEAVEARDDELEKVVKNYSDLSLTQPMPGCPEHLPRHILHHGDLRLRDPHSSKMDVHVFLFTDLLLITKVTQRKAEKVKIIRPPYHVERLIIVDLKDTNSIGLVSINEWNVAVAAFTLQCPDQKTHRSWHDALKRAKEQYKEAQQARDVMIYEDITCVGHLAPRSPRPGSSRASRVSSLAHSHSGSIDLNEHSPASTHHPPSFDMSEIRASSASSDDSIAPTEGEIQRSKSLESGAYTSASPRPERRPAFPKTPNTLSVVPPYSTGQSLPNLTVESANSLRVPNNLSNNPKALSACNRGVSYPPPSPRTLRRSAPVPQSRNPPLIKTRHVTSMVGSPQEVEQVDQDESSRSGGPRRISRTDRMDNRRYHTAGAIDDIKKQDTKDATIHKRLSWNYGQGPPPSRDLGNDQGKLGRHKHAVKSISCESMHSSSGVSSTSSLHRSMGSEVETLENIDDNELEDGESTVVDLTVSDCTSLKISPHISTTYICHDSDITLGVCSQYITQPNNAAEPSEGCENLVKIDVSETDPGISSVQITVTEGAASSSSLNLSSSTSEGASSKSDNMRMREILLNDASVEASDV